MLNVLSIGLLLSGCVLLGACNGPGGSGDGSAEWTDLSSLDHWRGYKQEAVPEAWVLDEGAIHLTGGGAGDLITREQFASFELELEWKISPRGNSGIMFHVLETEGATYMTGPEMQVLDNALAGGDLLHSAGADYALHAPAEDNTRPVGQWNAVRILVDGAQVEYWLNGVRQCAYELWSEDWKARVAASKFAQWPGFGLAERGHIALQDHGNPVWYRGIRIRSL
jgi:3-keto-disaccharide hydrolase